LETLLPHNVEGTESFSWFLKVQLDYGAIEECEEIEFRAHKKLGKSWKPDATEIEAALSLWLFHIHELRDIARQRAVEEEARKGSGQGNDWMQKDEGLDRQVIRLLGVVDDDASLRRDIGWWIGNDIGPITYPAAKIGTKDDVKGLGPIGFLGWESEVKNGADGKS
jgi:hypothetical protein